MAYTVYYLGTFLYCYHLFKNSNFENKINFKELRLRRLVVGLLFQRPRALTSKLMVLIGVHLPSKRRLAVSRNVFLLSQLKLGCHWHLTRNVAELTMHRIHPLSSHPPHTAKNYPPRCQWYCFKAVVCIIPVSV